MQTRENPETVDQIAYAFKFLSDRNRLRILLRLTQSESCVCDLIDELGVPQSLVSYHLGKLRDAGIVRSRRKAQWVYYSLVPEAWEAMTTPLRSLLGEAILGPQAAFGASDHCDLTPPDPDLGACSGDASCC